MSSDGEYKFVFEREDGTPWRMGEYRRAWGCTNEVNATNGVLLMTLKAWPFSMVIIEDEDGVLPSEWRLTIEALDDLTPQEWRVIHQLLKDALDTFFRKNN